MPPSQFDNPPTPAPIQPPEHRSRKWAIIVVAVLLLLTGIGFGASYVFNRNGSGTPKATPTPSVAPGVSTSERDRVTGQPLASSQLEVNTLTADSADIERLLSKALQVTGTIDLQGDLTASGNGTFGGNLTAANFTGNGSGLTGVNAALLGGQSRTYYENLVNGVAGDVNALTGRVNTLSANAAIKNQANTFTANNTFNGNVTVTGVTTLTTANIDTLILGSPLTVDQGGTGLTSIPAQGIVYGQGGPAMAVATPASAGQCLLSGATDVQWGSCSGAAAGVNSLNGQTGTVVIAGASGSGGTITLGDASTGTKGIASFNATNFTVVAGAVNTVQNISTTSTPTFGGLTLTSSLPVTSGGTGANTLTSNGVVIGGGTGALTTVSSGGAGLCLISTAGAPAFSACPGSSGVTSLDGQTGAVTIANSTGSAGTITVQDASTAQKGLAQFNSTNFTVSGGTANTIQNINTTATPTFAGLNTNTITPSAALTVGSTTQNATLQGANTTITSTNGANVAQLTFVAPTTNVTYRLQAAAAGTYDVCTTAGNCVGVGGSVSTSGGSTNVIPKYTSANSIGPSLLSDNGTLVTVGGNLSVTGTVSLTTALTVGNGGTGSTSAGGARTNLGAAASGANSDITSLSGLTTALSVVQGGSGATSLTANGVLLGNGTSPVSSLVAGGAGLCLISNAGAPSWQACPGGGAVTSVNGQTGAVSIANATGSAGTITIQDASTGQKGLAQFNATNFTVTAGTANTIQDIATGSSPTFAAINTNTITPSGALTVGATTQNTTIQGANTTITATNGASLAQLTFAAPTANVTYRLQTAAAGTYDVCTTAGNCVGVGGSVSTSGGSANVIPKYTSANAIGPSLLTDNGTLVTVGGNLSVTGTVAFTSALTVGNGGTGATSAGGARTNLGAAASGANSDITSLSGLTTALSVVQGGTGAVSLTANGVLLGNGTSPISAITGSTGQCLVGNTGLAPTFAACPGSGGVTSINSQTGAVTIANASGSAGTITIQDASTSQKGIAQFNATNFSASSGTINTIQDIATGSSPTFAGVNTNTITPSGALTVGATTQAFTVQGNSSSVFRATSGSFNTTVGFITPTANTTLNFPASPAGTYSVCTTVGNCVGGGGGVTTPGGTTNVLPKFSGAQTLTDSIISDSGTVVTVAGGAVVQGSAGLSLGVASSANGKIVFNNATNGNTTTLQSGAAGSNLAFTLPVADGASGDCLTTNASGVLSFTPCLSGTGGGGSGVASLNGLSGTLSVANASGSGATITINDASTSQKGIAQFNTTNFQAASGTINTIQDIATSSSPSFAALAVTSATGLTIGTGTALGQLALRDGSSAFNVKFQPATQTANHTITVPNASGTLAVSASGNVALDAAGNITFTGTLPVGNGGTGAGTFTSNGVIYGNGTSALGVTGAGSTGQCLVGNTGSAPTFGTCPGSGGVTSINSQTGAVTIANAIGSAGTITIDDATTGAKGIASFNSTNFSVTAGAVNTIQGISTSSSPSFVAGTFTGTTSLSLGTSGGGGNVGSARFFDGSSAFAATLNTSTLTANRTISLPDSAGTICLSSGNCLGAGATLQTAYNGGNVITTTDNRTLTVNLADTTTDSNFLINLQCTTSCSTNGRFAVQNGGTDVLSVAPNSGALILKNSTNSATAFAVRDASANNIFSVDTVTPRIGINLGGTNTPNMTGPGLQIRGGIHLSDSNNSGVLHNFTTPGSNTVPTRISVESETLSSGSTIVGLGLNSASADGSRAILLYDARTGSQALPALALANVNETTTIGLTWRGSNTTGYFMSQPSGAAGTANVALQSGDVTGGNSFTTGSTTLTTGTGAGTSANISTGGIAIDPGAATGTGVAGAITVGSSNASSLTLGRAGANFTLQGLSTSTITAASGGNVTTLGFTTPTANRAINFPNASGTVAVSASGYLSMSAAGNLTFVGPLNVADGGTGNGSFTSNGVLLGNGTGAITATAAGVAGQCLVGNTGSAPTFSTCPGSGGVVSVNGLTGTLTVTGVSGSSVGSTGTTITINDATASIKGLASFNSTNFSVTSGAVNTIQNISVTSAPTFASLALTATNSLSLGTAGGGGTVGTAKFFDGSTSFGATINTGTLTTNRTISLPDETGIVCLRNSANCGFAVSSGSGSYIANGTSMQTANFYVQSASVGVIGGIVQGASGQTADIFRVTSSGGQINLVVKANGNTELAPTTDTTSVFNVKSTIGNNTLTVDTTNGRVGIALTGSNTPTLASGTQGLEVNGALRLSGTSTSTHVDQYITPGGSSVGSKINIPNYDPGNFGQLVAMGLPSTAWTTSRGLSLFDARTVAHQPTLAVFNPAETDAIGFSWDGSNTLAKIKTLNSTDVAFNANGSDVLRVKSSGALLVGSAAANNTPLAMLTVAGYQPATAVAGGQHADLGASIVGADGGDTSGTSAFFAGTGGGITLRAGNGGTAPAGSTNGQGGNILLSAGATGAGLGTANTNGRVYVRNASNAISAFQVQNFSGASILNVNTLSSVTGFGENGNINGEIAFANPGNNNEVHIKSAIAGVTSYTLTLPSSLGASGDCLKDSTGAGVLQFGSCTGTGANVTLSNLTGPTAINTDLTFASGATRSVTVATPATTATAGNALTVIAATGNTSGAGGLTTVQGGTGGASGVGGGVSILGGSAGASGGNGGNVTISGGNKGSSGSVGSVIVKPQTGNDTTGTFQVQNAAGSTVAMSVDTASIRVGIGTNTPTAALHITGNQSAAAFSVTGVALRVASGSYNDTGTAPGGTVSAIGGISSFAIPTITASNTNVTYTNLATVYINGPPVNGTNVNAIPNAYALYANGATYIAGASTLNGAVTANSTLTMTAGALLVNGPTTGTGDTVRFTSGVVGRTTLHVQAITSQTADVLKIENNLGINSFRVNADGTSVVTDNGLSFGSGTNSTTNYMISTNGTLNSSATSSQYGIQNQLSFTPNGGSLTAAYGLANVATIAGSSYNLTAAASASVGLATSSGYTGKITSGYGLQVTALLMGGSQLIDNYYGVNVGNNTDNTGNTTGTINNYQIRAGAVTAAAGSGGTMNNYGIYAIQPSGAGAGTTNNYGIYLTGNGGGTTNYALYSTSTAPSFLSGDLEVERTSTTALDVQNGSGASDFTVDTSTSKVTIGPAAGDTVGTVLVLGNKTNAGDPTGVEGGMYYSSNSKAFRCYTSGTWRGCAGGVVFANTSIPGGNTVANTTTETNFSSNYTIPANDCTPGKVYKVTAYGLFSTAGSAPNLNLKMKAGTTVLAATGANGKPASLANETWNVEGLITCNTAGGSGTVEAHGQAFFDGGTVLTDHYNGMGNTTAITLDTTTTQVLQLSAQWSAASASNTLTLRQIVIEAQ